MISLSPVRKGQSIMTQHIHVYDNQFENGIAIEQEDGNRLEIVVVHLPGSEPTLSIASITPEQQETSEITELFSSPFNAA